jgi:hypothetical protein
VRHLAIRTLQGDETDEDSSKHIDLNQCVSGCRPQRDHILPSKMQFPMLNLGVKQVGDRTRIQLAEQAIADQPSSVRALADVSLAVIRCQQLIPCILPRPNPISVG